MDFFRRLLFKRSKRIHEFFSNAIRVYILKGEEEARCAALAAAKLATKGQRKIMLRDLSQMAENVLQSYPEKTQRKILADRLFCLRQIIESNGWTPDDAGEEKRKLFKMNEEYLTCLEAGDPAVFCRKYPKLF